MSSVMLTLLDIGSILESIMARWHTMYVVRSSPNFAVSPADYDLVSRTPDP